MLRDDIKLSEKHLWCTYFYWRIQWQQYLWRWRRRRGEATTVGKRWVVPTHYHLPP